MDPVHHQVLDSLPSRRKNALRDYFSSFPKDERRKKGQVCSYGYESPFLHRPKEFKPSMGAYETGKKKS